jgi:hypothetical protein
LKQRLKRKKRSGAFLKGNNMENYYVYAYLREDLTPYYIGKGKNKRAWTKCKGEVYSPKDKSFVKIIAHKLSEKEAFVLEVKLISLYGRKDLGTGILRNKSGGGEGTRKPHNKVAWNKGLTKEDPRVMRNAEKISKSLKGKTKDYKVWNSGKSNIITKGTCWYTNNVIELMSRLCPDGFIKGRLKKCH